MPVTIIHAMKSPRKGQMIITIRQGGYFRIGQKLAISTDMDVQVLGIALWGRPSEYLDILVRTRLTEEELVGAVICLPTEDTK